MRAFERFLRASMMVDDTDPQLLYNKAVTSYRLADFPTAFQLAGSVYIYDKQVISYLASLFSYLHACT